MAENKFAKDMMDFIQRSPSCFHVVRNIAEILEGEGFTELKESEHWELEQGGKYYVTRNSSSIISFTIPNENFEAFNIAASHSDSPSFKIKENPEMKNEGLYVKLNVEKYGAMLCAPWFDRPLSVAGRIILKSPTFDEETQKNKIQLEQILVNVNKNLLMIPNLAIHMNRDANTGYEYNCQRDMLPVMGLFEGDTKDALMNIVADAAGVNREDIVNADLFLYNREEGVFWGANDEFIASTKLDDLECAYSTLDGFLNAENDENVNVHAVFDNEEVGSGTRQGAASTFLKDTLMRINSAMGRSDEEYLMALAKSILVSADNAHAVHPNYGEKADPINRPKVNGGIVIKFNAAQRYCTDAISSAFFKTVCENANVPTQVFTNRSDIAGGSTLGNISGAQVSVSSVDIGLAQWAMHSPYESAGARDPEYMALALKEFYSSTFDLAE